jgi:hypothetical protein
LLSRAPELGSNNRVTIFLRRLEYFEGIMILTTNRITDFDSAMRSRIQFAYRFPDLGRDTRKKLWATFLDRVGESLVSAGEVEKAAREPLNRRQVCSKNEICKLVLTPQQIKNIVKSAYIWAKHKGDALRYTHLKAAIESDKAFAEDFTGHGAVEGLNSYT